MAVTIRRAAAAIDNRRVKTVRASTTARLFTTTTANFLTTKLHNLTATTSAMTLRPPMSNSQPEFQSSFVFSNSSSLSSSSSSSLSTHAVIGMQVDGNSVNNLNGLGTGVDADDNSGVIMLLAFFAIATVLGNAVLLICIFSEKAFRTSTNNFVASLTVSSLLVGTVIMPLAIYRNSIGRQPTLESAYVCEVWLFCDFMATNVTIFNIVSICYVRYLAIAHPLFYSRGHHRKICVWAPVVVWPVCLLVGCPRLFMAVNSKPAVWGVCAAGSPLDSAPYFVPVSSFLFIVGNVVALTMLLLIRRVLIKRAAEVVERRYSMVVPEQESLLGNSNNPLTAIQALRALSVDQEQLTDVSGATSIADSSTPDSPGGDGARERRRRWAVAAAARRKLEQAAANKPNHLDLGSLSRRSDGSVGLETILSASQNPSSLTISAACDENEIKIRTDQIYIYSSKNAPNKLGQPLCNSADRLSVVATIILPSAPELSEQLSAEESRSPGAMSAQSPTSTTQPPFTPESSPKECRRGSKPTCVKKDGGNFRKAERRLSTSGEECNGGLMIHRPKSSSIYQRGGRNVQQPSVATQLQQLGQQSSQQQLTSPASSVAQQLRSATSAMSLAVVEQLGGEEIAKYITTGRRKTDGVEVTYAAINSNKILKAKANANSNYNNNNNNNNVDMRNSYPKQVPRKHEPAEKQRSRSLLTNARASAVSTVVVTSSSSNTLAGKTRRTSFRSIRSSRGLSSVSMAIDGIVEGFVSDGVKATATLIMLVMLFSICGLPSVIVELANFICLNASLIKRSCVSDSVLHMAMWMSFIYNALNPLVYFSFNQQLRATLCRCIFKPTINLRKAFSFSNNGITQTRS